MENIEVKFQEIYKRMVEEKGSFTLFMIIKMDEFTDKWSLVLSTSWLTRETVRDEFSYIINVLNQFLTTEEMRSIARIGIFQADDYLVSVFTRTIQIRNRHGIPIRLSDTTIDGYKVHEAFIYEAYRSSSE